MNWSMNRCVCRFVHHWSAAAAPFLVLRLHESQRDRRTRNYHCINPQFPPSRSDSTMLNPREVERKFSNKRRCFFERYYILNKGIGYGTNRDVTMSSDTLIMERNDHFAITSCNKINMGEGGGGEIEEIYFANCSKHICRYYQINPNTLCWSSALSSRLVLCRSIIVCGVDGLVYHLYEKDSFKKKGSKHILW